MSVALEQGRDTLGDTRHTENAPAEDNLPEIDSTAIRYLQSFGDVTQRRLLPHASHGRASSSFRHSATLSTSGAQARPPSSNKLQTDSCVPQTSYVNSDLQDELSKVALWDGFHVMRVQALSHNRPLQSVALSLFERFKLVDNLGLDARKLKSFLQAVEAAYNQDNTYHNALHAADVTQTIGSMLLTDQESLGVLTDLEILVLLISAIVHDVSHPGLTNEYLVKTGAPEARKYNNQSVNENGHLDKGLELLLQPQHNFLEDLPLEDLAYVKSAVASVVLATDMSFHKQLIDAFSKVVTESGPDLRTWPQPARLKLLQVLVHAADISNPIKPPEASVCWAELILNELWSQGDREAREAMPVSALCDRHNTNIPKSQLGFLEFVVKPSFEALSPLLPKTCALALDVYGVSNREFWEALIAEGRNAFR